MNQKNLPINQDGLRTLYLEKQLSTREIASIFDVSREMIRRRLRESNIPIRTGGDAVKTQWVNNSERRTKTGPPKGKRQ